MSSSHQGKDIEMNHDKLRNLRQSFIRTSSITNMSVPTARMPSTLDQPTTVDAIMSKVFDLQKSRPAPLLRERKSSTGSDSPDTFSSAEDASVPTDSAEVLRLKRQLQLTNERMAQMDLEINSFRLAQHTVEQAIGSPYPSAPELAFRPNTADRELFKSFPAASGTVLPPPTTMFDSPMSSASSRFDLAPHNARFDRAGQRFHNSDLRHDSLTPLLPYSSQDKFSGPFGRPAQAPIGTRLSPTATEFSTWQSVPLHTPSNSYMNTVEPLNYRRLLDKDMNCDWKYIVDKIVCNNDQQASIFLQQKLKVGTTEQKFDIVQAIIGQAYMLMVNRFGNFLVQRCFEHGTGEQVVAIAQAIRGNTLNLSLDPFGCHVVQKAFDYVPEDYKAIMVHELLRRIPETIIHRYACHVWQKLFELRWSESPPQIMRYVNDALRGMWHEVALGETGSLVVQNIFENCLEEDKRPCIDEVLANIDIIAHGQFGNWCIQHICEHGAIADRTHAIDHVLRFATEYSIDQFASKVVEKCLKISGPEFLDHYLGRVCESRSDRPRMPLIDIAGDQFGNYLIHYILSNADSQRREIVATHIRKHMVSLRGSKYGSRVAMLCSSTGHAARADAYPPYREPPSNYRGYWPQEMIRPQERPMSGMRRPYAAYR